MYKHLLTPREHHEVKSVEEYRRLHALKIAGKQSRGQRVDVHEVTEPFTARVEAGSWLFDCDCGAGVSTDPEWKMACCFSCGAVYMNVIFPEDAAAIERLLVARPQKNRYWLPGETLEQVRADNVANGVRTT